MKLNRFVAVMLTVALALGTSSLVFAQDDAAAIYKSKCQVCHGPDGKADTAVGKKLGIKDFHDPEIVKTSDAQLFDLIKKGKDKMPAYDGKIPDDQIKQLVKYVRGLK
jgi:mono/diheme cytochrome c family protein